MRVQDTITFIISKNYGRPLSWSLPVWRVYVGGVAVGLLLVLLAILSVLYLFSYQRVREMEHETEKLRQERNALREQILSANQEAFEGKEHAYLAHGQDAGAAAKQVREDYTLHFGDELYQPPIRVTAFTTRVSGRTVEVSFQLQNQGDPSNNRGGYLFAIFENDDKNPVQFVSTPSVNTNADGFPETYKLGIRFTRIRDAVTFRRKVRRQSDEDYFTHVSLYLFSVRGGLLLRERFELERDLFFKDQPVVRTQQITSL
jgi:type II secretory pathway pseudopilin PulG